MAHIRWLLNNKFRPSVKANMKLAQIQTFLVENEIDGWLLYDFRGTNPIALHLAGLQSSGTRRWFIWIPAQGAPKLLIHAIEGNSFADADPALRDRVTYVSWHDLESKLHRLVGAERGRPLRIAMEYSPRNAVPYVSLVDAGAKEMVEAATGAEIVSSADLVQVAQAVLSAAQIDSHHRAAAVCLGAKDDAFAFVRNQLLAGATITDYDVQQHIVAYFERHGFMGDHDPIVAVNADAADPHYAPSRSRNRVIQQGDMLLLDLWAKAKNDPDACFGDITWTAYCGAKVPETVARVFEVAAAARDMAVTEIQRRLDAGELVYGYQIDEIARAVIVDAGFGDYILHRTGHSLGPDIHFRGVNIDNLETQDQRQLMPGVMFTIEPGIYMPTLNFDDSESAKGLGIRTEINCLMHAGRVETTTLPLQTAVQPLLHDAADD